MSEETRKSKLETRNPKQIQNLNIQMTKTKDCNGPEDVNGFDSYVYNFGH